MKVPEKMSVRSSDRGSRPAYVLLIVEVFLKAPGVLIHIFVTLFDVLSNDDCHPAGRGIGEPTAILPNAWLPLPNVPQGLTF